MGKRIKKSRSRRKYKRSRRKYKRSRRKYKRSKHKRSRRKKNQRGGKGIWAHWKPLCSDKWLPGVTGFKVGDLTGAKLNGKTYSVRYDQNVNRQDFPHDSMVSTSQLQKGGFVPIEFTDLGSNIKDSVVNTYRGYKGIPKVTSSHVLEDQYIK